MVRWQHDVGTLVWEGSVPAGPYNGHVRTDGYGLVAAVSAGPEPGGDADTPLVFIGDDGPSFSRQVNERFKDAKATVGSQYIWWTSHELKDGSRLVTTIFGPADTLGNVDYTSLDAGWQSRAHLEGDVTHIGGRGAGEEYFAIDAGGVPRSVRAIIRGTSLVLDDAIAARVFNGMTWLRKCCNNAEPSIGVGEAGRVALATTEVGHRTRAAGQVVLRHGRHVRSYAIRELPAHEPGRSSSNMLRSTLAHGRVEGKYDWSTSSQRR